MPYRRLLHSRLSTIKDADTIVVVHEGTVIESGAHDVLMAKPLPQHTASGTRPPADDGKELVPTRAKTSKPKSSFNLLQDMGDLLKGPPLLTKRSTTSSDLLSGSGGEEGGNKPPPSYRRLWEAASGGAQTARHSRTTR